MKSTLHSKWIALNGYLLWISPKTYSAAINKSKMSCFEERFHAKSKAGYHHVGVEGGRIFGFSVALHHCASPQTFHLAAAVPGRLKLLGNVCVCAQPQNVCGSTFDVCNNSCEIRIWRWANTWTILEDAHKALRAESIEETHFERHRACRTGSTAHGNVCAGHRNATEMWVAGSTRARGILAIFLISLFDNRMVHKICQECNLPWSQVIYSGSG